MANFKLLSDLYRFPGFVPQAGIRGVFGEPRAVVIALKRRRKKRFAARVGMRLGVATTNGRGVPETSLAATSMFTSPSFVAEFCVLGAAA